ncbi:phospholipase D-like domain-containing protein [Mesorhizobium sp. NZP2298]|uniref:phospholipase D-like domain-containing protein n=1 Tax=Mesorhizobium sp. NZP2298 TaxID=2483403 RepID=UPI001FED6012|nr:phospholipase D-like domain-containing protein [Mesorhizobium sp. NZP2298]
MQLFELQPFSRQAKISVFGSKGASLHTKAFSVDDRVGFVGSFNFDPRSVSLNSEMGVLFEDEKLVAELRHRFKSEIAPEASCRLELKNEILRCTVASKADREPPLTDPRRSAVSLAAPGQTPTDQIPALAICRQFWECFADRLVLHPKCALREPLKMLSV